SFIFFFQAEDGIRDDLVTGVQTCALPILRPSPAIARKGAMTISPVQERRLPQVIIIDKARLGVLQLRFLRYRLKYSCGNRNRLRSEERRVGKECRFRWVLYV